MRQISVFLENTSGRLAELSDLLAREGINLRAISLADTADFGILRLITDQVDRTLELFLAKGFSAKETRVLAVEVEDKPGGLSRLMQIFRDGKINIEYLYASLMRQSDGAIMVFKVNQVEAALELLEQKGYKTLIDF